MTPKKILSSSLQETYRTFREQYPECSVSFSKFVSLRPKQVHTMSRNTFNNCLCEYCTNIELKVKAINLIIGCKGDLRNRYNASRKTLCPKEDRSTFYKRECVERNCSSCGRDNMIYNISDLLKKKCSKLEWSKWENQMLTIQGKKKTRKMLQLKKNSVDVFMIEFRNEINIFSAHLHNAAWQYEQFSMISKDVPDRWVVFCMDFAENYTCLYQDEAQSAHWSHNQVTLFSIVAYYRCPTCKMSMTESLVFITEDRHHDSHAVYTFVGKANDHLKSKNIEVERQIHYSDGAPSQFKSKTPFADVRKSSDDYGFPVEKHFFGTRHGKGPCDGEFGVVKRSVSSAVMSRNVIVRNATEFYEYAREFLSKPKDEPSDVCCHTQRSFFFVDEHDINRKRPDRINVKAIPNTRQKHAVKPSEKDSLSTRLPSCFCKSCVEGSGECENAHHVDKWEFVKNPKEKKRQNIRTNKKSRGQNSNKIGNVGKIQSPKRNKSPASRKKKTPTKPRTMLRQSLHMKKEIPRARTKMSTPTDKTSQTTEISAVKVSKLEKGKGISSCSS